MTRAERIEQALTGALVPTRLMVADDSHKHAGHAGARPEGETHYRIEVVVCAGADDKENIHRTLRKKQQEQRMQQEENEILAAEFDSGLHALQMKTLAPAEDL